jgi:hypothetical protein
MLYFAWYYEKFGLEIESYQAMALNYFYLGDLKKARYYHLRFLRGKTENGNSLSKKTALSLTKAYLNKS